jgi:tetratricopeptide (TPR) repeat protein
MTSRGGTLLVSILLLLLGCSAPPASHHHGAAGPRASTTPPLFDDLGGYHRAITTRSPQAQAYFDQGLQLVYGFNHYEAQAAFREAARLDPECAMCAWGLALTYGSNYNSPTDAEREQGALAAVTRAQSLAVAGASERERAIIGALARRHSPSPAADRTALDRAYADAMREVASRFSDDLDTATLYADALMNLRPWSLWTSEGAPQPGTQEIVVTLERVLAIDPMHPGANHLYIHAVEASPDPHRAEAAEDRLLNLMPGAGHNLDFVWHAASMEGRGAECVRAAREFAAEVPAAMVLEMPDAETAPAAPLLALARFARRDEILKQPAPPEAMRYVTGTWRYARGLAYVATGRRAGAEQELATLREVQRGVPADPTVASFFTTADMLALAAESLAGEIAVRTGDPGATVGHLAEAVRLQDRHWFTEPPPWYYPVRQSLGFALLQAGRAAEAEAVYREDLRRNPENGWSLFGLARSLRAQGRSADAAAVEARFRLAWARADVTLTSSRL